MAGYDLTFSPVKSVSALWALAGPEVAAQIEAAHGRAGLAEYLQRRADLVHALAAAITADQLPATGWAQRLRAADPDLAR